MTSPLPPLPAPLSQALADKGYATLTPVQEAVLEPRLAGRDLLVSAQTGSGKTVAFGLAMAADLLDGDSPLPPPDSPRALIIAPTRELALQVRREFEWLYAAAGAVLASCVGGMDIRTERRALERGAHIVVATPGRLRDHIERHTIDLSAVQAVVLDEADEMLDLGFREDLEFILGTLPAERRTLLFSATVSPGIERLAQTYQRDAERLATAANREAHGDIEYRALTVHGGDAENAIVNVLRYYEARNALVFCKTRAAVNHLTARFLNRGFAVVPLSGELAQEERARALQAMRDGRARVCVATDVAARGIDLPGLDLVIHADLPTNKETLLHRSGRTGRAGNKGVSVLITPLSSRKKTERLLSFAGIDADWAAAPTAAEVADRDTERLLTDEVLTTAETPEENALVTMLAERFTSRELAAGLLRSYFAARSAPEDITPVSPDGPKPRARAEFERSFWMRLSTGRNERAEPRWLLPMLCRAGDLTKEDIGAIRIFDDHTVVQLHNDCRERFVNALGDGMELEQGIKVTETTPPPEAPRAPRPTGPRPPREGGYQGKNPRDGKPREGGYQGKGPRSDGPRSDGPRKPAGPRHDRKSEGDNRTDRASRPYDDRGPRPKPVGERPERPDRPARKPRDADAKPARGKYADRAAPAGDTKPARKPRPDDRGDAAPRPAPRKFSDKPGGKPAGKPAGKPGAKPAGKPFGDKPVGKAPTNKAPASKAPSKPRIDPAMARDPSARLGAPKGKGGKGTKPGKPGARPRPGTPRGADARPTRPKR